MRKDHVSERFVIVNPENGKVKATKKIHINQEMSQ